MHNHAEHSFKCLHRDLLQVYETFLFLFKLRKRSSYRPSESDWFSKQITKSGKINGNRNSMEAFQSNLHQCNTLIKLIHQKTHSNEANVLMSQNILDRIVSHPDEVGLFEYPQWFSVLHYILFHGYCAKLDSNACNDIDLEIVMKVIEIERNRLKQLRSACGILLNETTAYKSALMTIDPRHGYTPLHVACALPNCNAMVIQLLFDACPEVSKWPYSHHSLPPSIPKELRDEAVRTGAMVYPLLVYVISAKSLYLSIIKKFSQYLLNPIIPMPHDSKLDILRIACEKLKMYGNIQGNIDLFKEFAKAVFFLVAFRAKYLRPDFNYHDPSDNSFLPLHSIMSHASNFMIMCETDSLHFFIIKDLVMKKDSNGNNPLHILTDISRHTNPDISKDEFIKSICKVCKELCERFPTCVLERNNEGQNPL